MNLRFSLGQLVETPGARETFTQPEKLTALMRHAEGDWGDLDAADKAANDRALEDGSRILSAYTYDETTAPPGDKGGKRKLWIITEAEGDNGEREATTLLLPSEY